MEKNEIENSTSTKVAVEEKTEDLKDIIGDGKYNISAPLFLMFSEYLGYVGKTLPWVDSWCVEKKKPEDYKVRFIEIEAVTVLREAKEKYTAEKLRELYDSLYEVILFVYDDNLKEMEREEKEKAEKT